jgi:hypothetical protein
MMLNWTFTHKFWIQYSRDLELLVKFDLPNHNRLFQNIQMCMLIQLFQIKLER